MAKMNQHDIITKQVLSQKTYAVDFLKNSLPSEITSKLDFTKLRIEKGNFINTTSHVFSWNLQNEQNARDSFSALSRQKEVGYSYVLQQFFGDPR